MKKSVYLALLILIASVLMISCKPDGDTVPAVINPEANTQVSNQSTAENQKGWTSFTAGNGILDLLVNGNDLWAATSGGVVRWDIEKGTNRKYTTLDGLGSNTVGKIIQDSRGNIWTTTYIAGVNRFDGGNWKNFTIQDGLVSDDVITLASDKLGGVWVSAYWGVSYFDGAKWQSFTTMEPGGIIVGDSKREPPAGSPTPTLVKGELSAVDVIFVDSRGDVWFSDRGKGVTRFDGKDWQFFSVEDGLAEGGVSAITEDKDHNLWFGGIGGITRFDGAQFQVFTIKEFQSIVPRPFIQDIMQDNQGNIWVAAYQGGVSRFDGVNWRNYTTRDGLDSDNARLLFLNSESNPSVTTDKGVNYFGDTGWQELTMEQGQPVGEVRAVVRDSKGRLWFGTAGGISCYNSNPK
jgi:ligand-binding sensor domain-containing protein